jgi:hypothetical protein
MSQLEWTRARIAEKYANRTTPETTRDLMEGDLVLRRDTQLDQQQGRKLEAR